MRPHPIQPKSETDLPPWFRDMSDLQAALDEHAIVAITDTEGRITYVNDKFCEISKYSREELIGQDHRIINSGFHSKEFFGTLWQTILQGQPWHGEIKNLAKDGSYYWVATTIVPSLGEDGQPRRFVSIRSDITGQKAVEGELAQQLSLQRLLADLSARFVGAPTDKIDEIIEEAQRKIVLTFELDRSSLWQRGDGESSLVLTHVWQRPGWPRLPRTLASAEALPWAHGQVTQGRMFHFSRIEDLPPEASSDVEMFRKHGPKSNVTIPLVANNVVFGAIAFATLNEEHEWKPEELAELKLIAQIISNVLSRQRAEMREEQLRRELTHAMRVATLGELASALAHEINQPLAAILSNAQAARRFLTSGDIATGELGEILEDIVRDDKRAGNVIRNLRAMVSKQVVVREPCNVNDLVREVAELMHAEFISERIELRLQLQEDLPPVDAASVELQQLLVNLLVNAMHAMKDTPLERRYIWIETAALEQRVSVRVIDQGHGLPDASAAQVFQPFFSTKATGLGLGLSICRRIIENHLGTIEAQNAPDGGAIFAVTLPFAHVTSKP